MKLKGHKVYYKLDTDFSADGDFTPNVSHVQVGLCPAEWGLEDIFTHFNTDINNTEAFNNKIGATPNLHHASMSVGDVVEKEDGRVYVCAGCGWRELAQISPDFREIWR